MSYTLNKKLNSQFTKNKMSSHNSDDNDITIVDEYTTPKINPQFAPKRPSYPQYTNKETQTVEELPVQRKYTRWDSAKKPGWYHLAIAFIIYLNF